jgi:hypothetical protein
MKRRHPGLGLIAPLFLLLVSCAVPEVSSFAWKDAEGRPLRFSLKTASKAQAAALGREGSLGGASPARLFVLAETRLLPEPASLELELRRPAAAPATSAAATAAPGLDIALFSGTGAEAPFLREHLVLRDEVTRLVLPLAAGSHLRSLSLALDVATRAALEGAGATDGPALVKLVALRELRFWQGIEKIEGGVRLSTGIRVFRKAGEEHLVLDLAQPEALSTSKGGGLVAGTLLGYGAGGGAKSLSLQTETEPALRIRLHPAGLSTFLPLSVFSPRKGRLELVLPGDVDFSVFSLGFVPAEEAELADLGTILRVPRPGDGRDFDAYRWDVDPAVLILDFKDYGVQDGYLKRLAFFVEKEGFRGRLARDEEIAPLHGWNAHDYRPSDLAAFFEKARSQAFPLNAKELILRDLLLRRGLIVQKDGSYGEGRGAFVSITRESEPYLRTTFLSHESSHAIFFTDAAYRSLVQASWKAMDAEEKWYWKLYFGWMNYDTKDEYLMANEYQAYLLQQTLKQTEAYFTKTLPSRLVEKHPELVEKLDAYMVKYGPSFEARAAALDAWLMARYGFGAGRLASY